jgi:hypothetical protein
VPPNNTAEGKRRTHRTSRLIAKLRGHAVNQPSHCEGTANVFFQVSSGVEHIVYLP